MNQTVMDGHGSTDAGLKIINNLNLGAVTNATLIKKSPYDGGPADLCLTFKNEDTITIINSFGIGYGGTGPNGVVEVLVKLGIPREKAEIVFTCHDPMLSFNIP